MTRTLDFMHGRGWGHDVFISAVIDKGQVLHIGGWGGGPDVAAPPTTKEEKLAALEAAFGVKTKEATPQVGDYLILDNSNGGKLAGATGARYQVEEIRRPGDPPDMWFATVRYAPEES